MTAASLSFRLVRGTPATANHLTPFSTTRTLMTTKAIFSQAANAQDPRAAAISVVLVEDDHDLRHGIADYLRLQAIDVTDVASGIGFYTALNHNDFDEAILDVNLPDVSGFELARAASSGKRMGVIMLTARANREDRINGYEHGADLYLTKPVDGEELALAIGNLARRIRAIATPAAHAASSKGPSATTQQTWLLEL